MRSDNWRLSAMAMTVLASSSFLSGLLSGAANAKEALADQNLLKGKVEQHDGRVRLPRPATPRLGTSSDTPVSKSSNKSNESLDLGSDGFKFNFAQDNPLNASASPPSDTAVLQGEAQDKAMVIAWEEWHRRVCSAIFENWKANGLFPGVAHARLCFTKDRHVSVTIQDVEIHPSVYMILPVGTNMSPEELERTYSTAVVESVKSLDGSSILEFPKNSKRAEVILTPAFRGTHGPANFTWKKDDYEHVRQ